MELNYDFIELFIKKNPIAIHKEDVELSNKEKKFLGNYVDELVETYDI